MTGDLCPSEHSIFINQIKVHYECFVTEHFQFVQRNKRGRGQKSVLHIQVDQGRLQVLILNSSSGRATILQLCVHDNVITRQRNRASVTRKNTKNVKVSLSKWSSHNEHRQRHNAIIQKNGLKAQSHCCSSVTVHSGSKAN